MTDEELSYVDNKGVQIGYYEQEIHDNRGITLEIKSDSNGVNSLLKYYKRLKSEINDEKEKPIYKVLKQSVLNNLDLKIVDPTDIDKIIADTGLTARKIRDFFRNQRKRYIKPISEMLTEEFHQIVRKANMPDQYIIDYINDLA